MLALGVQSGNGESRAVKIMVDERGREVEEERSYGGGVRDAGRPFGFGFVALLVIDRTGRGARGMSAITLFKGERSRRLRVE